MKKILSFDGGGIFGVIPLQVLADAEKTVGSDWSNKFDLIVGNSAGAIAASCLASGFTAEESLELFTSEASNIFDRPFGHRLKTVNGLRGPKYSSKKAENIFRDRFNKKMGETDTNLMIVSYDLLKFEPYFFKSWRDRNTETPLHEAALASMAAPTHFKTRFFKDGTGTERNLIDGGITANNPSMCAYAEARRLWPDEDICIVSFGTGQSMKSYSARKTKNWGLLNWATKVSFMFIDGGIDAVDYQLRRVDQVDDKLDYLRIDTELDQGFSGMDDTSKSHIDTLRARGSQVFSENENNLTRILV